MKQKRFLPGSSNVSQIDTALGLTKLSRYKLEYTDQTEKLKKPNLCQIIYLLVSWPVVNCQSKQNGTSCGCGLSILMCVIAGCGGDIGGPSGSISSPGYPNKYPDNRECIWYITTSPGSSITLTIHEFDVEFHDNCNYDVLEVSNVQLLSENDHIHVSRSANL